MIQLVYKNNAMSQEVQRGLQRGERSFQKRVPSTSRTEVNIERVRQVVYNDRQLTIQMITSQLDIKDYPQRFRHIWKVMGLGMLSTWQFLLKRNIIIPEQPLYSPDFASYDFFLFPKIKAIIKGTYFESVENIKRTTMTELRGIPKESFQQCIEVWQRNIGNGIKLEADYFDGESI